MARTEERLDAVMEEELDAEFEEIKETEKRIRKEVQKEVVKAKEWPVPDKGEIATDIFANSLKPGDATYPPFVRMPDMEKSFTFNV